MTSDVAQSNKPIEPNANAERVVDENFKKHLIKEVARMGTENLPISLLWQQLKYKIDYDCEQLWFQMRDITTKKLKRMILVNDQLQSLPKSLQLTPTEWLLFDLILVHENMNITNCKKLPRCIKELCCLTKKYKVDQLIGDALTAAWIDITLEYNKRGRQCSPMLLQLRWYQIKAIVRREIYKPAATQRNEKTKLLHSLAINFQKAITHPLLKWDRLVKEKRVMLPNDFEEILSKSNQWGIDDPSEGWYLQLHDGIYKCNPSNNEHNLKCSEVTAAVDHKEFSSVNKENLKDIKIPIDVSEKLKSESSSNIGINELTSNDVNVGSEIISGNVTETILQEKTQLLSIGSETIPEDITGNKEVGVQKHEIVGTTFEDGIFRQDEMVETKNEQIDKDIDFIDTDLQLIDGNEQRNKNIELITETISCEIKEPSKEKQGRSSDKGVIEPQVSL